ncbi:MAG: cas1 [Gemmatimonadales bacterium]|nr:cas1 [Gemmatimonadales bacterium]
MGDLLARVCREQALLAAWEDVREAGYADGEPGSAIVAFENRALRNLAELAEQVAVGGYKPRPMTGITIAKPSGGVRDLAIGAVPDRIVERAVLAVLDPLVDPVLSPWSFAFRRGLGVKDAIRALTASRDAGAAWVARTDVDDCFPSIPRWPVLERLRELVPDVELIGLVERLITRPVMGEGRARGSGLHQGSSLSPLLANLYLDAFDRALMALGYQVIRYCDDIAIPAPDRPTAERVLELATAEAKKLRLELNMEDSRAVAFDDGVPFLGQTVTATTGAGADPLSHPQRTTVYVATEGALLRVKGDRLRVEAGEELLANIHLNRVRQVVCQGRVGVTSTLLHRFAEQRLDLVWLHDDGAYAARLAPLTGGDATRRLWQYAVVSDPGAALRVARPIVAGKIANMRSGLLRAARSQDHPDIAAHADRLAAARLSALDTDSPTSLLGHEGTATRDYFAGLALTLGPEWEFTSRQRRPPPDPVNAMLSFAYTLLLAEAVSACEVAGLDPHLGVLHTPRDDRPSLALDLIEEVRPAIADAVVVRLVRTGQLTPADFTTTEAGCRLDDAARRRFLAAYERRMLTLVHHADEGRRIPWRQVLYAQARRLAAVFEDREPEYVPVGWR